MKNSYATVQEYKDYVSPRGQAAASDVADDGVIESLLESSSRYIDSKTFRHFYPRVETRLYSTPSTRNLELHADLLEVLSFLNGDTSSITAGNYHLLPENEYPKLALELKFSSLIYWLPTSSGDYAYSLSVNGYFGYHNYYLDAWEQVGTLGAAMSDTTTLAFTMTAGHSISAGQIVKIGSELLNVHTSVENTITPIKRGDNGSTAAAHINGSAVYAWRPIRDVVNATLELTRSAYQRRFGRSTSNNETITAAGVVISPRDVPAMTSDFIKQYLKKAWM